MSQQLLLDIVPPVQPTLDNFVSGQNGPLIRVLQDMVQGMSKEHFVYLWGELGSGRTHLLKGFIAGFPEKKSAKYISCSPSLDFSATPDIENLTTLVVDNVEQLSEEGQIALFNIYNRLRDTAGYLVASGSQHPAQLKLRKDLQTRLSWGLSFEVVLLNDLEKIAALQEYAMQRGMNLSQDVARYLLNHERRDMRSLIATIDLLDHYSLEQKRAITVPLLRELLQNT